MSFEEFLENGKPEMSVIIQRVADLSLIHI